MSAPLLGVVLVLTAAAAAVLIGLVDTAVRRSIHRHVHRALDEPYRQPTHCRVIDQRQELNS